MTASVLPGPDASPAEVTALAFAPLANTSAFNHSHHPAMSVPCGLADGLPIGMMFVGRFFAEGTIYRAAHLLEQHQEWRAHNR